MNTCILGVDPGINGAIAFYFTSHPDTVAAEVMPTADNMVDAATLSRRIEQIRPDIAVVEMVGAMPGQGVSSMFRFGQAFGIAIGVIAAMKVPVEFVAPARWKKHYRLGADKEEARSRALQLWPARAELFERKKDHGKAEAALIARYLAETQRNRFQEAAE